jgi:hypothetical protein
MVGLPKRRASESAEIMLKVGPCAPSHSVGGRSFAAAGGEGTGNFAAEVRKYLTQAAPVRREAKPRARPVWATVGARASRRCCASPSSGPVGSSS